MTRRAALALAALAAILAVSAGWWALALWPASTSVPAWVERTRAVCFGVAPGGLPSTAGWISLIGEPVGMLGFLLVVWGSAVHEGITALRRSRSGRATLVTAMLALVVGAGATLRRVVTAGERFDVGTPATPERLDRPAPPLSLVDQFGDTVQLSRYLGRPVIIAFAYSHCETVCPVLVHDALRAIAAARTSRPVLLVVTLDPWRDTPSRLPSIAAAWQLPADARALSGSVDRVTHTLDDWEIARVRDPATGEVTHQTSLFLVDRHGRLAYVATTGAPTLGALLDEL